MKKKKKIYWGANVKKLLKFPIEFMGFFSEIYDFDCWSNQNVIFLFLLFYFLQVGNFIHYLSTFLAGLVVGFVSAWRLALLSVAVIPGIAFAGGLYAYTLTGLNSKSRESYANAGIIAEQVSFT